MYLKSLVPPAPGHQGKGRQAPHPLGPWQGGLGSPGMVWGGGHGPVPHQPSWVTGVSLQGMNLAKGIRDQERGGRSYVGVVDGENEKETPKLMEIMNHVLGQRRELKAAVPDKVVEPALKAALKLYQ